jgi:hypothetical protein
MAYKHESTRSQTDQDKVWHYSATMPSAAITSALDAGLMDWHYIPPASDSIPSCLSGAM